jgi:hypothetical protein
VGECHFLRIQNRPSAKTGAGHAEKRQTASPGLPLGGVCDFHAYWHDSRQVFGLAGCLLAPASQFKFCPWLDPNFTSALVGVFVPAYRCGAVPDLRRIPFSGETCDSPPKAELTISCTFWQVNLYMLWFMWKCCASRVSRFWRFQWLVLIPLG